MPAEMRSAPGHLSRSRSATSWRRAEPAADEGVRADTSLERLAALPPVFAGGGVVTAGNSSGLNDGACAMIIASEAAARANGTETVLGVDPSSLGLLATPAQLGAVDRYLRTGAGAPATPGGS